MYKFADNQIGFLDYGQPAGMKMSSENRWVKKAEQIPWEKIEERYAGLFTNRKGNVAKPLRLALGACIIQAEYGYSDEEVVLQIQEGPYLQFFCGFSEYKDEKPFDPSLMVYFRKRLTPEILGEINELIIGREQRNQPEDNNKPSGSGTLIVDATCAPSQIRFPTDTSLLNEARENSERIIDCLHSPGNGGKPRTYRERAHREYVKFVRRRKPGKKEIRQCIRKQLGYLGRNLGTIDKMIATGKNLSVWEQERLETLRKVYAQQKHMYDSHTHSVPSRIVSIAQPFIRPIVRGKARAEVEFGAKLDISITDGYARLETFSFDNYNESMLLETIIERYKERTGHYPERVLADKIYRNRDNLGFCKEHGIRLSGPALGRPKKDTSIDRKQEYTDICDRVEVERNISLLKRKCGLGLMMTRLAQTTACAIALSVIVLNLRKIWHALFAFLSKLLSSLAFPGSVKNFAFVQ